MNTYGLDRTLDIVVIGAGPPALVLLHAAKEAGLDAIAIDKGPLCGALIKHPTYMRWFSTAEKLELCGFPLQISEKNPTRREYLKYCRSFVDYFGLNVVTYREVTEITCVDDRFRIVAKDMFGRDYIWFAKNVVVGTGFYDSPRPMNVPGEDLPKTSHQFTETHFYSGHDVLVVGAGSSAAEIALELWRDGARVTIVMRGDRFHTKYWVEPDIENRIKDGDIACYRNAEVVEIRPDDAVIRDEAGETQCIANDFVLAMTGYEPDTSLLESVGVDVDRATGKPTLSENLETNVAGVYVLGTLSAGYESNVVFIENSRGHGPTIVKDILGKRAKEAAGAHR